MGARCVSGAASIVVTAFAPDAKLRALRKERLLFMLASPPVSRGAAQGCTYDTTQHISRMAHWIERTHEAYERHPRLGEAGRQVICNPAVLSIGSCDTGHLALQRNEPCSQFTVYSAIKHI
jgi:hypothetical protein